MELGMVVRLWLKYNLVWEEMSSYDLPPELWCNILRSADIQDLISILQTNESIHALAKVCVVRITSRISRTIPWSILADYGSLTEVDNVTIEVSAHSDATSAANSSITRGTFLFSDNTILRTFVGVKLEHNHSLVGLTLARILDIYTTTSVQQYQHFDDV